MSATPQQIGPYRIQAEIGRGGMAVVYRAVDTRTGTVMALKVLPPQLAHNERYLQRFEREGKSVARLRHPNIVRTVETGAADGFHYMAMQYVDGQTLTELLRDRRTLLPFPETVEIIRQVAAALDYAHNLGVLHRDIKNSNIMIDREGHALLMDFGVAKLVDEDNTAYTMVGTTVGTPSFMAPEQARGGEVDRRADIYSLGVIAYTLFTGSMPFKADSQPALLHKIVYEPPQQPEELNKAIPTGILYALKKVLAKSPSARFATAGDFAQALAKGLTWNPTSGELRAVQEKMLVTSASQSQIAVPTARRRGLSGAVLVSLAAVVALATAVFLFLNPSIIAPTPAESGNSTAPATISLTGFQPAGENFRVEVPDSWEPGSTDFEQETLYTFDAPDRIARVFALQWAAAAGNSLTALQSKLDDFLAAEALPYTNIQRDDPGAERRINGHTFHEQNASATWKGRPVAVRISAVAGATHIYLVGMVVEAQQAATFEPLRAAVVNSLNIDLQAVAETAAETVTALPAETSTDTSTYTPTAAPTETPAAAITTAPATPTPDIAATVQGALAATLTAQAPAVQLPTPTETPGATATPSSTPAPTLTATPTPVPTATHTVAPTADIPATQTAEIVHLRQALAETLTALPTATATDTPIPSPTPTAAPRNTLRPTATPLADHHNAAHAVRRLPPHRRQQHARLCRPSTARQLRRQSGNASRRRWRRRSQPCRRRPPPTHRCQRARRHPHRGPRRRRCPPARRPPPHCPPPRPYRRQRPTLRRRRRRRSSASRRRWPRR